MITPRLVDHLFRILLYRLPFIVLLFLPWSSASTDSFAQQPSQPKARIDPGLAFTMQTDSDKRIALPRLTQFPDSGILQQVNADLQAEAAKLQEEARRCDAAAQGKSDWGQTARLDLLTRDVMSLDVEISYFCGGPHPDVEHRPLTYNLRTGKRFDFSTNAEEFFLGDAIPAGELAALYRKHIGTPESSCDPSPIDPETQLFLHFTAEGLAIVPELPHFEAACGPEIVIPYREIKPLVKSNNPFASLFQVKRAPVTH